MRGVPGLILVALLASGCVIGRTTEPTPFRTGLWPLWTGDAREWAGVFESRAAGPLLHLEVSEAGTMFEMRPWLSTIRSGDVSRWDLLFPLVASRRSPDREQLWVTALARSRTGDVAEHVWGPLFFGRDEGGRGWGGLFPIGGVFRGHFGFDRVEFALWPLWARGYKGGYREVQIAWPFFAFGRGDGRFKLRVWPLFGIDRRGDRSVRQFFLWPFIHKLDRRLDTETPDHALYVIPFWGRRDLGSIRSRFVLFPLWAHSRDSRPGGSERLDLLWPLFSRVDLPSRGGGSLAVRPLFAMRHTRDEQSRSWLLGLWGRSRHEEEGLKEDWRRVLWVARVGWREEEGQRTERVDVWPLYRSTDVSGAGGPRGFRRFPWLVPARGLDPDGWDRHYNKLFELYGERWLGDERRSSWLWGLRETRTAPGREWVSWGGFLHWSRLED